ncbi:hypothetical protein CMV_016721 [Castanea mollissima]|uniref:Uncharacterized protein n=1 Tax=Castanea mollissima TaxID=60419 RepID=A0A8J4VRH6_9ROSI|nr:hypothetical protein CMV_016721 [Castanea mollissima]
MPPLLGPPELHLPAKLKPITKLETRSTILLSNNFNPCLEFFLRTCSNDPRQSYYQDDWIDKVWGHQWLDDCLEKAWKQDPLTTLKLIYYQRIFGGSDKTAFYAAAKWLHKYHPLTLACNAMVFGAMGWFHELLEILHSLEWYISQQDWKRIEKNIIKETKKEGRKDSTVKEGRKDDGKRDEPVVLKKERNMLGFKLAVESYQKDGSYRYLHNRISDLFSEFLRSDMQFLCSGIARKVFPRDAYAEYRDIEEAHYAYRVRNRLQTQVLAPLRKALESRERNSGAKKRESFTNRAVKESMKSYKKIYEEKDEGLRFRYYLMLCSVWGRPTIGAGLKFPHQIIASLKNNHDDCEEELQWGKLIGECRRQGKFRNCLAICGLSESMRGTFMEEIAVAMGLFISELSDYPWKGKVFTFSEYPKFRRIEGDSLRSKAEFIRTMDCKESLNFIKVYDRIRQIGIEEKVNNENMVKRIFVFTDRDFETVDINQWASDYKEAWKSSRPRGYKTVPEIVFWNLKDSIGCPREIRTEKHHRGWLMLHGYSKTLMSLFLKEDGVVKLGSVNMLNSVPTPEDVMKSAISREEFNDVLVLD